MPASGVIVKAGRLNLNKRNCYVVLMVSQRTRQWEVISKDGFRVVCASKLEAREWATLVGSRTWPRPDPEMEDDAYTDWLLTGNRLRIQPYEATDPYPGGRAFEIWMHEVLKGWAPGTEDVLAASSRPLLSEVFLPRWEAERRDR